MTEIEDIGSKLHSAEHMFARSLQNLGLDIHVKKADTFRSDLKGIVIIKEIVPLDKIHLAESETNKRISEGLSVSEKSFPSLEAALKENAGMRFNEERLAEKGEIRTVKIGDFDVCACKNKHVKNTGDISLFAVTKISYLGGETEIQFKVGDQAKQQLFGTNSQLVDCAYEWNFEPSNLRKEIARLRDTVLDYKNKTAVLAHSLLKRASGVLMELDDAEINVFLAVLEKFKNENPLGCKILLSKSRLIAIKGKENATNLKELGESLKKRKLFLGDIRDDYLNGKVLDHDAVKKEIENLH